MIGCTRSRSATSRIPSRYKKAAAEKLAGLMRSLPQAVVNALAPKLDSIQQGVHNIQTYLMGQVPDGSTVEEQQAQLRIQQAILTSRKKALQEAKGRDGAGRGRAKGRDGAGRADEATENDET